MCGISLFPATGHFEQEAKNGQAKRFGDNTDVCLKAAAYSSYAKRRRHPV
jgi:hypothetical protein